MKLGTCAGWQVGVKAPGTAKITTLRPFSLSCRASGTLSGPSVAHLQQCRLGQRVAF
jgi:hypothetical protein